MKRQMSICHFLAIACVFASLAEPVSARDNSPDHLVPEQSVYFGPKYDVEYESRVIAVLRGAFDADVRVRMIAEPSFQPEYTVGLSEDAGEYRIFALEPAVPLYSYQILEDLERGAIASVGKSGEMKSEIAKLRSTLPADYHDVKVNRCQTSVDSRLGGRLIDVWQRMLLQTRFEGDPDDKAPETETIRMDGEDFHFSMRSRFGALEGKTWSPSLPSKPAKLVEIAETMRAYCTRRDDKTIARLSKRVDALLEELNKH
jgi:hypothetical protein